MGASKRMPSFSQRPGFPSGLHVLLVDPDDEARARTEAQLRECSYEVTACASCAEAVVQLSSPPAPFDVLLADSAAIGCVAAARGRSGLLDSCRGVPCILMGANPSPADVMRGVSLGAVDFLAKPLSQLKLRNIWQHTVRRMMDEMRLGAGKGAAAAAAAPAPALDRSGSNALVEAMALDGALQEQAAAKAAATAAAGLPPRSPTGMARSPPLRARRSLHACISSTNLAVSSPASDSGAADDGDFDFDAAVAAAAAACDDAAPAAAPAPAKPAAAAAPTATAATAATATATATATHVSVPPPSCGVPVPGGLPAQLPRGMVWGMPMPVVRAPGIVPPRAAAPPHAPPPAVQMAAPWSYACCPMPPAGYMQPPPAYMMAPPPHMAAAGAWGNPYGYAPQPPRAAAAAAAPHAAAPTGATAAQALEASLGQLLGGAEDDFEVDLDEVLCDLAGGHKGSAGPAAAPPAFRCPAPKPVAVGGGYASDSAAASDASGSAAGGLCGGASSPGSLDSCRERVGGAGGAAAALEGFGGGFGFGALDDGGWDAADDLTHLPKSGSFADLLAVA
ncbi:hypothetical protein Rsub_01231 [Raphidocelis subcapitata]|uniref:Response regulatory domain-containing protein n=1 Tax=Raphidocelis subcapitata TaxID=307507 RepID=A0A2V0NM33_9CHLO|nr:hypothetical protein Rsub_01231 [Raphidocelis subcapitata]|eukprot:GBF88516.1 hypothetical protein Rsub_01231 [Raphidocelis subcapitata]